MRRTTPLTAAALLGLAAPLLAITSTAADAAAPTCRGQAATIVGSGGSIDGHRGTGRRGDQRGLLGQHPRRQRPRVRHGNHEGLHRRDDRRRRRRRRRHRGARRGRCMSPSDQAPTRSPAAASDDRVTLDYPDPGAGPDVVHGGGGSDALYLQTGPGAAVLDNATGRFTSAGELRTTWSGLEKFWLWPEPAARDLTVVGSDADGDGLRRDLRRHHGRRRPPRRRRRLAQRRRPRADTSRPATAARDATCSTSPPRPAGPRPRPARRAAERRHRRAPTRSPPTTSRTPTSSPEQVALGGHQRPQRPRGHRLHRQGARTRG